MKTLFALCGLAVAAVATPIQFFDDFNRANAGDLGPNWTNVAGTIGISGGMAKAPDQNWNLAIVNGYSDLPTNTSITFDVFHGQDVLTFAGALLGYLDFSNNVFVKVQDNAMTGNYNRMFFYHGYGSNNLQYYDLVPFTSARVHIFMTGTVATLDLDTDFNGTVDQSYSHDYIGLTLGTGAGLGAYGDNLIDNYGINSPVPEPATLAILGLGLLGLARRKRA